MESIGAGFGDAYRASGIVLVSAGGRRVYEQAFGYANYEARVPIDDQTSFRIGNVTKLFTAVAILKLVEAGKLSLDDPVSKHLPGYPEVGAAITIRHLLFHRSGLPSYKRNAELMERRDQPIDSRELLESFWEAPLEFEPGSDFRFSDSGYVVLGKVIEAVTGQSYQDYLERAIFSPHGLTKTGLEGPPENSAIGYRATPAGERTPVSPIDPSLDFATGSLRSSAADLLEWGEVLARAEALGPEGTKLLETPGRDDYSPGGFVRRRDGHHVVVLAGEIAGFFADFMRVPELDLVIVVLSNSVAFNAAPVAETALRCTLGEPVQPLEVRQSVEVPDEVKARFLGTYQLGESAVVELRRRKVPKKVLRSMRSVRLYEKEGKLFFKPIGQSPVVMNATSENSFVLMGGKASVQVSLPPDDSEATELSLLQGPLELEYVRKARVRGKPQPLEEEPPPPDRPFDREEEGER